MSPCAALFVALLWVPKGNQPTNLWLTSNPNKISNFKPKIAYVNVSAGTITLFQIPRTTSY